MPALKRYQVMPSTKLLARAGIGADAFMTSYLSTVQPTDPVAVIRKQSTNYLLTHEQQLGSISVIPGNIAVVPQRDALGADAMTTLAALNIGSSDQDELIDAIDAVQAALDRPQLTQAGAVYAIQMLTHAIDELANIDADAADAIAKIGILLGAYQTQWRRFGDRA